MDVVIVNYNTRDQLARCITAALTDGPSRLLVVDNASTDGSADMVRSRFPQVELVSNAANVGYGAAANAGIAACESAHVLLLNSDVVISPGTLQALATYLDTQPKVSVVGPRLVGPDGRLQVSCFPFWLPFPLNALAVDSIAGQLLARAPGVHQRFVPHGWQSRAACVPWVVGAAIGLRRMAFRTAGGFDSAFFMYFEEVDLCLRLAALGWEVHFAPVTTVVHVGGLSTRQRPTEMAAQYLASTLLFYRRHSSGPKVALLTLVVASIGLVNWLADNARLVHTREAAQRRRVRENAAIWGRLLRSLRHQQGLAEWRA
jgi:GT2 family glycosyltransferase